MNTLGFGILIALFSWFPTIALMTKKKTDPVVSETEIKGLIKALKSTGFEDYVQYIKSPWRIMMMSFVGGVFRGLGILVGMTIVVSLLIWFMTQLVDFPLIGKYFEDLLRIIENLAPDGSGEPQIY